MVCKPTSCLSRGGFTVTELLVGMSVGLMAVAAACALFLFASQHFAAITNYMTLADTSKTALARMSRDIRMARSLTSCSATRLTLLDMNGHQLQFVYNPTNKTLSEITQTSRINLLENCDSFSFSVFQRTPVPGSYSLYPTTDTNTSKVIQAQWSCSRRLKGSLGNSEGQVSARIVMRNR